MLPRSWSICLTGTALVESVFSARQLTRSYHTGMGVTYFVLFISFISEKAVFCESSSTVVEEEGDDDLGKTFNCNKLSAAFCF